MATEMSDNHKSGWAECFMAHQREGALQHAKQYLEYGKSCQSEEIQSSAEFMLLQSEVLPARMSEDARISLLEKARTELEEKIQRDKSKGWYYGQIEKQLLLVEILEELGRLQQDEAEEIITAASRILENAEAACGRVDWKSGNVYLRYEIALLKGAASLFLQESDKSPRGGPGEALPEFVHSDHTHNDPHLLYNNNHYFQQLVFAIQHESLPAFERLYKQVCEDLLNNSESSPKHAELLIVKGMVCYFLLEFEGPKIKEFWTVAGIQSMTTGARLTLDCFEKAFHIYELANPEATALTLGQTYFTNSLDILVLDIALEITFALKDKNRTWQWIQRCKARGISEMLKKSFNSTSSNLSYMPDYLSLPQNLTFEDLQYVQTASSTRLVFVDWITFGTSPAKLLFYSFNMDRDREGPIAVREMVEINSTLEDLSAAGQRINEARMNDSDAERYLRPFMPVVRPLENYSRPGDILLLSLTAPLHNVPLHAVLVGSVPLIERNPVVYVPSHAALISCLQRRAAPKAGMSVPDVWQSTIFGAYDDEVYEEGTMAERQQIYESLRDLAGKLGSKTELGENLTKTVFEQHSASAELVHFHGHGISDGHDPTRQSLALGSAHEVLTMSDITKLNLQAAHITLISCSAGVQDFSLSGDEPLGLLSSFLLGGASSVIGALWPIQSSTGRLFTRIFYDYFLHHLDRTELGPIVNLARALQHSMLKMRGISDTRMPYHWAAFVLYGSWFCRRKPGVNHDPS